MATFRCRLVVCTSPVNPDLITESLFDKTYSEFSDSPIDEFLIRLKQINQLSPHPTTFDPLQGQLVLLGVVAAVESYIRTLFRRLISLDPICQQSVHDKDVSYGAALHLPLELLPEAILERISFLSKDNIWDSIKDLLGVKGVPLPSDLKLAMEDFGRICQLRNCTVHRFGKLGSNNAIKLGLAEHHTLLEKPLKLDYTALQNSIAISTGLVKTLNNFLFNEMLSRLPENSWAGGYQNDKATFQKYYRLFADKVSVIKTAQANKLYREFMIQRAKHTAGK